MKTKMTIIGSALVSVFVFTSAANAQNTTTQQPRDTVADGRVLMVRGFPSIEEHPGFDAVVRAGSDITVNMASNPMAGWSKMANWTEYRNEDMLDNLEFGMDFFRNQMVALRHQSHVNRSDAAFASQSDRFMQAFNTLRDEIASAREIRYESWPAQRQALGQAWNNLYNAYRAAQSL